MEEHKGILVAINAEKILHANEQIPVSYTHLDVYKRQLLQSSSFLKRFIRKWFWLILPNHFAKHITCISQYTANEIKQPQVVNALTIIDVPADTMFTRMVEPKRMTKLFLTFYAAISPVFLTSILKMRMEPF